MASKRGVLLDTQWDTEMAYYLVESMADWKDSEVVAVLVT